MSNQSVQFCLEEEHALAAARLIMRRKLTVPILPFLVLAVVVAGIGLSMGADGVLGQALPVLSWLVLVLAFVLGVVQFWVVPRQRRRMYQQTSLLRESLTFSWDDDGFALEGESAKSRIEWEKLFAWDEGETIVILMQNEMLYNLVPKAALDDWQLGNLRNCLEESGLRRL